MSEHTVEIGAPDILIRGAEGTLFGPVKSVKNSEDARREVARLLRRTRVTPPASTDRGSITLGALIFHSIFAILAVAAFWSSHFIGHWCGVPIVAVALAWVAAGVGTVAKGERPRPPMGVGR